MYFFSNDSHLQIIIIQPQIFASFHFCFVSSVSVFFLFCFSIRIGSFGRSTDSPEVCFVAVSRVCLIITESHEKKKRSFKMQNINNNNFLHYWFGSVRIPIIISMAKSNFFSFCSIDSGLLGNKENTKNWVFFEQNESIFQLRKKFFDQNKEVTTNLYRKVILGLIFRMRKNLREKKTLKVPLSIFACWEWIRNSLFVLFFVSFFLFISTFRFFS